jgi:hypothetical protein
MNREGLYGKTAIIACASCGRTTGRDVRYQRARVNTLFSNDYIGTKSIHDDAIGNICAKCNVDDVESLLDK